MRISILNDKNYIHRGTENIVVNEKIFDEELFNYKIIDREDFIDDLINWISECKTSDRQLMKEDLKYLMKVKDDYIFSSILTNEYIISDDSNFEETCAELIELNESLK